MEFSLPLCLIPFKLNDYLPRVKKFYEDKGKKKIEKFAIEEQQKKGMKLKILNWDSKKGLTNITLDGESRGLDLNNRNTRYEFHNIHDIDSPEAQFLFSIAKKYIYELNKN